MSCNFNVDSLISKKISSAKKYQGELSNHVFNFFNFGLKYKRFSSTINHSIINILDSETENLRVSPVPIDHTSSQDINYSNPGI